MDAKKALYRAKLKEAAQKRDKRIDSPLVRYNEYDQPICRICDLLLKSESLWPAHQASRKHHEAITKFKANAAGQAQTNTTAEPRTELVTKVQSSSMLPADFFDKKESKRKQTGLDTGNSLQTDTLKSPVQSLDSDSSARILGKRKESPVTTKERLASSLVNEQSNVNTVNAKGRKQLIHTSQKSSNLGSRGALPESFFDGETTKKMDCSETMQLKGTLPDGFFDSMDVETTTKMDESKIMQANGSLPDGFFDKKDDYTTRKNDDSEVKQVKGALPEGFFDNKDADLRARGIQPVKTDIKSSMAQPITQDDLMALVQAIRESREDTFIRLNKQFVILGAHPFTGEGGALQTDKWIRKCDEIFEKMNVTEIQKRQLASHQLKDSALYWWQTYRQSHEIDIMTWDGFKEQLSSKFLNEAAKLELTSKFISLTQENQTVLQCIDRFSELTSMFISLTQENQTVLQYTERFSELACFAPTMVDTEQKKVNKYIQGLKYSLRKLVLSSRTESFERVCELAMMLENVEQEETKGKTKVTSGGLSAGASLKQNQGHHYHPYGRGQGGNYQNKRGNQNRGGFCQHEGNRQRQFQQGGWNQNQRQRPQAQIAQTPQLPTRQPFPTLSALIPVAHQQDEGVPLCYRCGQPGHMARHCPNQIYALHQQPQGGQRGIGYAPQRGQKRQGSA